MKFTSVYICWILSKSEFSVGHFFNTVSPLSVRLWNVICHLWNGVLSYRKTLLYPTLQLKGPSKNGCIWHYSKLLSILTNLLESSLFMDPQSIRPIPRTHTHTQNSFFCGFFFSSNVVRFDFFFFFVSRLTNSRLLECSSILDNSLNMITSTCSHIFDKLSLPLNVFYLMLFS